MLRRILFLGILTGLAACEPDIAKTAPTGFVTAVFDPTTASIPLPNDLAFSNPLNEVCPTPSPTSNPPACAQAELLASFAGKFPSDQEVAITIDFTQTAFDSSNVATQTAPDLDLTTFTSDKFFMIGTSNGASGEVSFEPLTTASYVKGTTKGTLTLHHKDFAPWTNGQYTLVIRGGADGVKTKDAQPIYASQVFDLIAQGKDMTDPANIGLLKAQTGSTAAALVQGAQLNQVIDLYKQTAFPVADTKFPHEQLAIALTFQTQPDVTNVTIDPARGLVPLPIDLLRDATTGHLTALAACTLAGSKLDSMGNCPSAAAGGFEALDGFSTTGAILGPTSELIEAKTITATSLQLYDLTDPAHPALVPASNLILEPCEFTSGCGALNPLSPVIAIQPAGPTAGDPSSVFRTKPLKDNTDYAVVMTTGIHDKAGNPIGPGTVAKIVRFQNAISISGKSQLVGIDDATAAQVEKMRVELQPVFSTLAAGGVDSAHVAMAYTFHTQTILSTAVKLGALPYSTPAATAQTGAVTNETAAVAFAKYGVNPVAVPSNHIHEILEVDITTFNLLDDITGAFNPDPTMAAPETIHVMIATPLNPAVTVCGGALAALAPAKCAPLMVFRHGLGGGRADMLTVADTYAANGMVTIAIDAAKHGDRAYCTSGEATTTIPGVTVPQCSGAGTCVTTLPSGAQGDTEPPGKCTTGFFYRPVSSFCSGNPVACGYNGTNGIPVDSSNYLVTSNFFRTRDTFRQDFIDQSQLIRALAFLPGGTSTNSVFTYMISVGGGAVVIDPTKVYFSGQSLGSIQGVGDVATNPRISKAAFNVGGGTVVDIFTNSPAFVASTNALLASLGVVPGTSQYLQFLVVAKTVLDPADPINYAGHLTGNTLPNLLADQSGATPQATKKVLAQAANCDATVPNPFNLILAENFTTVGPLPSGPAFFAGGTGTFQLFTGPGFIPANFGTCATGALEHGFLTDWTTAATTFSAQSDISAFVVSDTIPFSVR
jgi:hypothetical protein